MFRGRHTFGIEEFGASPALYVRAVHYGHALREKLLSEAVHKERVVLLYGESVECAQYWRYHLGCDFGVYYHGITSAFDGLRAYLGYCLFERLAAAQIGINLAFSGRRVPPVAAVSVSATFYGDFHSIVERCLAVKAADPVGVHQKSLVNTAGILTFFRYDGVRSLLGKRLVEDACFEGGIYQVFRSCRLP